MPFGLKNAPQIFQRRMDNVFKHLYLFCLVYVDDILITSSTPEEHQEHLQLFAQTVQKHGIVLSQKKS